MALAPRSSLARGSIQRAGDEITTKLPLLSQFYIDIKLYCCTFTTEAQEPVLYGLLVYLMQITGLFDDC